MLWGRGYKLGGQGTGEWEKVGDGIALWDWVAVQNQYEILYFV